MHTAIVDYRTSEEELQKLKELGLNILLCPQCSRLYPAVDGHPDMQLCIADTNMIVHRDIDASFIHSLSSAKINIIFSYNSLNENYPQDIILNSMTLGDIFVHKIDSTDPALLNSVRHKKLINVKQGYTKCSTAVLNKKTIMTSDTGIASALTSEGLDILLLPPGDIELPGLNYGFIGGACGILPDGRLAFFGDLTQYAYGEEVLEFLKKHNIEPVYLKKGKLTDRGTLFCI